MPKAEVGSTKFLNNKLKSKGLQRLRWYCQVSSSYHHCSCLLTDQLSPGLRTPNARRKWIQDAYFVRVACQTDVVGR